MYQKGLFEWPYPVNYEKENEVSADILVLGGGIAGCHAAIVAARSGARVVLVDKGATKYSGQGGAGVDHWHFAYTNPCSKVTPEEMTEKIVEGMGGFDCGIKRYIEGRESWDTLLDVERMGVKIRDTEDEFKGAAFRDEETKLMFAYDYENKHTIRICGHNMKPTLYKELKKLGVSIYERVMVTSLLTEGGKQGTRVVGATGLNVRTGEFYIFKAKATINCMPLAKRLWEFTEPQGFGSDFHFEPTNTGEGYSTAWFAGAKFTLMEASMPTDGNMGYIPYGVGNAHNTWHGCTIVDANGKEIQWFDRDGREITLEQRFKPAQGQKVFQDGGGVGNVFYYETMGPQIDPKLPEKIKKGEVVLPLYADLAGMPEYERRAIFGLMVGNEGKTRYAVYDLYTRAGFDPDKDMLQVPVFPPDDYAGMPWWWASKAGPRNFLGVVGGGLVVDWELKTSLEGLYAAGNAVFGFGNHASAATTGRYAARNAVHYASTAPEPDIDRKQVEREKARIYAPIKRDRGIRWKDLNAGICRVMQDFCGLQRHENTLKMGLNLLKAIKEEEIPRAYAANPHELMHVVECMSILAVGEMVIHQSLARKASSMILNFFRLDYPELDPDGHKKFITINLKDNEVEVGELPLNYYLQPPYASSYKENYERFAKLGVSFNG